VTFFSHATFPQHVPNVVEIFRLPIRYFAETRAQVWLDIA
jgi:hypothetical protein